MFFTQTFLDHKVVAFRCENAVYAGIRDVGALGIFHVNGQVLDGNARGFEDADSRAADRGLAFRLQAIQRAESRRSRA